MTAGHDLQQRRHAGLVVGRAHLRTGVGDRAHDLLLDARRRVGQPDRAELGPPRLRHLRRWLLEVHDARPDPRDRRLRDDERLAEAAVEADRDVTHELEVLALVVADRYPVGVVEEHVGGLQHRVVEQPDAHGLLPARLLLELRHPAHLAERGDGVEDPCELGVLPHVALHEQDAALGVDAHGHQQGPHRERRAPQLLRLVRNGDRVQVDHAVHALVGVLVGDPMAKRPEQVAQVGGAGGLDAREDTFACGCHRRAMLMHPSGQVSPAARENPVRVAAPLQSRRCRPPRRPPPMCRSAPRKGSSAPS